MAANILAPAAGAAGAPWGAAGAAGGASAAGGAAGAGLLSSVAWPLAILGGASMLPKLLDMFTGKQDNRTAYERQVQNKLMAIINQGGLGLPQKSLNSRFQQMMKQLQPIFKEQEQSLYKNTAGRGVYKSGYTLAKGRELGEAQSQQAANLLQNLTQWNEEMKLNTLLQALGMGADVAGRAGDISRLSGAQNQMAFNEMWGNLLGLMVEKNLFNF